MENNELGLEKDMTGKVDFVLTAPRVIYEEIEAMIMGRVTCLIKAI